MTARDPELIVLVGGLLFIFAGVAAALWCIS